MCSHLLRFHSNQRDMFEGRFGIIAGSGHLPVFVAEALWQRSQNGQMEAPFLALLRQEADPSLYQFEHCEISTVEFAHLVRSFKKAKVKNIILAGGVRRRPQFRDLRVDMPTLRAMGRILFSLGRGDDALLRAFIKLLETYGFQVIGADQAVPELLAPAAALLSKKKPGSYGQRDIKLALEAAQLLGKLDIGQGAVAIGGRVVAVEGVEGTDEMLARICALKERGLIRKQGGVLVKAMKPDQERRVDLPTIGIQTIENAQQAKLDGIAIVAGESFILDRDRVIRLANDYGLFLVTI